MEYLLDLEIIGNKIVIPGDKKGIWSINLEHESVLRFRYCIWKEGYIELMKVIKSQVRVGVKVKETVRGLHSTHEILIKKR